MARANVNIKAASAKAVKVAQRGLVRILNSRADTAAKVAACEAFGRVTAVHTNISHCNFGHHHEK